MNGLYQKVLELKKIFRITQPIESNNLSPDHTASGTAVTGIQIHAIKSKHSICPTILANIYW